MTAGGPREASAPGDRGGTGAEQGSGFSLRALGTSAALLTLATASGQIFALGRELFIADRVGISPELDALLIALVAPTLVAATIGAGTTVALLPASAAVEETSGRPSARRFVSGIIVWVCLASAGAAVLVVVSAQAWIGLIGPGLDPAARSAAERFVPLLGPVTLLAVVTALLSSVCQIEKRFGPIAVAWLVGPVASLAVTIGLYDRLGLAAFALGMTAGFAVPAAVLLAYVLRCGLLPVPALRMPRTALAAFGRHAFPLTLSGVVNQLKLVADRAVASLLPAGSVSALRYGETLVLSPTQAIAPGWSLVVYPALVRETTAGTADSFGGSVQQAVRHIVALLTPLAVATIALAPLVVNLVYRRGAFDARAAEATATVVASLGPMFVLTMIQGVLVPAHNARRRGTFLLVVGVVGAGINLALNVALGLLLGVAGIGLSTSLTLLVLVGLMAWDLERSEPGFDVRAVIGSAARATAAALVPAIPIGLVAWTRVGAGHLVTDLVLLAGLSVIGAVVYVVVAARLGLREPMQLVRFARSFIRRANA